LSAHRRKEFSTFQRRKGLGGGSRKLTHTENERNEGRGLNRHLDVSRVLREEKRRSAIGEGKKNRKREKNLMLPVIRGGEKQQQRRGRKRKKSTQRSMRSSSWTRGRGACPCVRLKKREKP